MDSFMEIGVFFTAISYSPARVETSHRGAEEVAYEVPLAP